MDSLRALAMGESSRNKTAMVFDWDKAAQIIRDRRPSIVSAGLRGDWEFTGGTIFENEKPVTDSYTFLLSTWATPEMEVDGEIVECFIMADKTKWNAHTKWPDSSLRILSGESSSTPITA